MTKDQLVVLDGSTFFVTNLAGDCLPTQESGFFRRDIRHLSTWQLRVDGQPMRLLTSRNDEYYGATIFGTLAAAAVGRNPPVAVRRTRVVADGLHEELVVENDGPEACRVALELRVAADFADLFEVKQDRPKRGGYEARPGDRRLTLAHARDGFRRETVVTVDRPCQVSADALRWQLELAPHERWRACLEVTCTVDGRRHPPRRRCGDLERLHPDMPMSLGSGTAGHPPWRPATTRCATPTGRA